MGKLSITPTPVLPPTMTQWGQPWGQPWNTAAASVMPAVDMLVLPKHDAAQESTEAEVKVVYTSAEDLAESLFPTSTGEANDLQSQMSRHAADIEDLSDIQELVREALLEHRDQMRAMHDDDDANQQALWMWVCLITT